ncbi:MAG: AraC family transcriptional regulator, partial [Planctomycetota bacterium]|nr:AraC family transcriptional regulator [Planctomycetota bacterium]
LDWHFNRLTTDLLGEVRRRQQGYEGIGRAILIEFMHRCLRASTFTGVPSPLSLPARRWLRSPSAKGSRRKTAKAASEEVPGQVQVAQDFIHSNYHTPIKLDDVSAAAETSSNHLGRLFKSAVGKTPMQYLADVRMEAARQLLRTDLKIAEVARLVGIEDPYYFSRAFKRIDGVSPLQHRRKMKDASFSYSHPAKALKSGL